MERIGDSTATAEADKHGPGKSGFYAGPDPCTIVTPDWADAVQEEIAEAVEATGATLDPGSFTQLRDAIVNNGRAIYGDGSDGSLTLVGNSSLSRDTFYDDLDLAGFELRTDGFRLFVRGTLTFNGGSIHNDGLDGTSAGTPVPTGSITLGYPGNGGAGGNGGPSLPGVSGGDVFASLGGAGGAGGDGVGAPATGRPGGLVNAPNAGQGTVRSLPQATTGTVIGFNTSGSAGQAAGFPVIQSVGGGSGGGGGGSSAASNDGGGGAAGGGVVMVAAWRVVRAAAGEQIRSEGGDGLSTSGPDSGGGGGGGGGGVVILVRRFKEDTSGSPGTLLSVAGGAGGTTGLGGNPGAAGAAGTAIELVG